MILRLALVALTIVAAWGFVAMWERRPGRAVAGLLPGVTLVTADGCRLCAPALTALTLAGAVPAVLDIAGLVEGDPAISSVPTAIVTDRRGRVVLRRTGRSVITDAKLIADAASGATGSNTRTTI